MDVILAYVRREQFPSAILADRLDCGENDLAARLVKQVGWLRQMFSLERQQEWLVPASWGTWQVVIAID
jgi:hypothetical protein